jgi:sigma-54 specific flagellar transcriptional regulator A
VAAGRKPVMLSAPAMECLTRYNWPGNVRELGNLIERLSILCSGRLVTTSDLPPRYLPRDWTPSLDAERIPALMPASVSLPVAAPEAEPELVDQIDVGIAERDVLLMLEEPATANGGIVLPAGGIDLRAHVAAIEESLLRQALDRSNGVVAQAARLLGLRRTTLVEKLRKYGMGGTDEASAV